MSLNTLQTKIDNFVNTHWATIVSAQEDYKIGEGHYFQGLTTHTGIIDNTDESSDTVPDNLAAHPTDHAHDWTDLVGTSFNSLPFPGCLTINVYESPGGHGWLARLDVLYNAVVYERTWQVGNLTELAHDWRIQETGE
jgi:hypothetical protein